MRTAILELDSEAFETYQHLDIEQNWRSIGAVRMWLKFRQFDLTLPILVSRNEEENTLTFYQTVSNLPKTVVLIHPNPDILKQLDQALKDSGHSVYSYSKVEDANFQLNVISQNKLTLHKIIVPRHLRVMDSLTYKQFLNQMYPNYQVLTIDNKDYRDTINLKAFKKEYENVI